MKKSVILEVDGVAVLVNACDCAAHVSRLKAEGRTVTVCNCEKPQAPKKNAGEVTPPVAPKPRKPSTKKRGRKKATKK